MAHQPADTACDLLNWCFTRNGNKSVQHAAISSKLEGADYQGLQWCKVSNLDERFFNLKFGTPKIGQLCQLRK
ncbi:hypothetical protein OWV82_020747 [Melia azedarach]|uniref:Uncharacterized protein n=1 Tax=Melia azedarach TaxID=155640 RepID=A0ACC1X784_MELAZ|nr:hypothetical protein OWV82_020747 [Melia azedarach]